MINVDMWNGAKETAADSLTWTFYPNNGEYRGNLQKDGQYIGDFVTDNFSDIKKRFYFLF